ncbi:MAG TPA: DEAD/DEAH box helicase family protein [Candidatus Coprovicinus avistercoris]|uniref:DEAD/DEAH box helicase family protein n=1 Tax=Candidatus Coprovicinus avistercoris TaxID=2840754 RepID=A0A9D1HXW5_9ACTN|nr:DEAD/DEAH box helicase family protein [Candidatus Coprovicinus avistercoris]
MNTAFIDNRAHILKDELIKVIRSGNRISIASSVFSVYAYDELREQLESLDEFRFIYTEPTFSKEQVKKERREFYIPRLNREQGLYGTEFEIKLRNELTQKVIASEFAQWVKQKAHFKSPQGNTAEVAPALTVDSGEDVVTYMPINKFTVSELGVGNHPTLTGITRLDNSSSKSFLTLFDQAWESDQLEDVTQTVIENIEQMYRENPPEFIYYMALYRIFHEFLDDISADNLPKEGTGFRNTSIWNMLYDFQKDAALSIINKLQTYNGCILADSVGLGKTFTALAVIKYYELCNRYVLVLCPKKLSDNWMVYRNRQANNPFSDKPFRYDVLYHTDLSRKRGRTVTGIDLETFEWGSYDLVVIDESHNFRNGADTARAANEETGGTENRYQRLLNRIIKGGVDTKVLMLSATPVNNRFRDLRNQLALAYQGDPVGWSEKLGLSSNIEDIFRNAQGVFNSWSKLPSEERTTQELTDELDFDFFRVLDQVTVARSRKHIQRYYDVSAIGPFPRRNKPISVYPKLSTIPDSTTYSEIANSLDLLKLAVYIPSHYLLPSARAKYEDKNGNLTTSGRETGVRKLMAANLLKRLESSIASFRLTLERVLSVMTACLNTIEAFKTESQRGGSGPARVDVSGYGEGFDLDAEDTDFMDFSVGGKSQFDLRDMDWKSWEKDVRDDAQTIEGLLAMVRGIDAEHDDKLLRLEHLIAEKVAHPLNPNNKKIIVFTAFADTANYLYEHISEYVMRDLELGVAEVTGMGGGKTTVQGVRGDLSEILTCFSPISKDRDKVYPRLRDKNIDILIATDCISEGQNLQDCDYLVNYDIHWNPVRIVQRFGRVDRIGSRNKVIQLVNFWPDEDLDNYINLKARVENRMHAVVMSSTGDDDYINEDEKGDLEYRKRQLEQMRDEVVDLEDVSGGVSITDLGLNDFRMDLVSYFQENPDIDKAPTGIDAVVEGDEPGVIFVLRNVNQQLDAKTRNQIHPFYLVYVSDEGEVVHGYLDPKETLDAMRRLCRGKDEPDTALCRAYNKATKNGRDMRAASQLLRSAIESIVDEKAEEDLASFFTAGTTSFLENDVAGLDDFELICFLVVRPRG